MTTIPPAADPKNPDHTPNEVGVLFVGSGPAGVSFARTILAALPCRRVLMVEIDPQLTPKPGINLKNVADHQERRRRSASRRGHKINGVQALSDAARTLSTG